MDILTNTICLEFKAEGRSIKKKDSFAYRRLAMFAEHRTYFAIVTMVESNLKDGPLEYGIYMILVGSMGGESWTHPNGRESYRDHNNNKFAFRSDTIYNVSAICVRDL
jgi:hypothetical protein